MIHSVGYGGQGPFKIDFELEAEVPDAPVTGVFPSSEENNFFVEDAKSLLELEPELTAGDLAMRTGGQNIGLLAEKETGKVVFESGEDVDDENQYPWGLLNTDPLMQQ